MIPLASLRSTAIFLVPIFFVMLQNLGETPLLRSILILAGSALAVLIVIVPLQILSWAFYTYRYEAGYLHIKSGVIFKKERSIKRERIQTVNISRGIVQRLLGLAGLQVETAGGGAESELSLTAVALEEAYNIKRGLEGPVSAAVAAGEEQAATSAKKTGREEIYRISASELFLAGATSGGFFVLFSLIGLIFSQALPFIPDTFWEFVYDQVTSTTAGTVVLVVLVLLIISWLLSALAFMVQYANFTLHREQDRLHISWGLIEQKQLALNIKRLQALVLHEGLLRQPFGRCALVVEVAGGGSRDQNYITVLFPLLKKSEIPDFLARILPEYRLPPAFVPLPRRALRRYFLRAFLPALLLIIPLQWVPYGWLSSLLLIPALFWGYSRYRAGGTCVDEKQLTLRFRFINRFQVLIRRNCLQALQISANPFQRFRRLRTLTTWVLSSPSGKSFQVTDIDIEEAGRLWSWYSPYF